MVAFNLTLGLRMVGCPSNMLDFVLVEVIGQRLGDKGVYCGWISGQIYGINKGDSSLAISAVSNSAGVT